MADTILGAAEIAKDEKLLLSQLLQRTLPEEQSFQFLETTYTELHYKCLAAPYFGGWWVNVNVETEDAF